MTRDSFLRARPWRRLDWREADDGLCVVLRPKFGGGRIGSWLAARVADPHYRIRLDELGTFVWKACDGETSVSEITAQMRQNFGSSVEPAEPRLTAYIRRMVSSRLLELRI